MFKIAPFKKDKMKPLYRVIMLLMAVVLVVSTLMTGTLAWSDFSQHKTNVATGGDQVRTVLLHKYEKDTGGTVTPVSVKDAEFYLYDTNDVQIGNQHYVTDANGEINIPEIAPGNYYFLETRPSYGYVYDKDGSGEITRYDFTVKDTDVNVVVNAFNRKIAADLTITKEVKNADGTTLTQAQLNTGFIFSVTFSDNGTYNYTINDTNQASLTSGGTLTLKHGDKALFTGIPVGVTYNITETAISGYVASGSNHQGTMAAGGCTADFINTYTPDLGKLAINKTLQNANGDPVTTAQADKAFVFTVVFSDNGTYNYTIDDGSTKSQEQPLTSGGTISLKNGETALFEAIPAGVTYTVTEADYTADNYTATTDHYSGTIIKDDTVTLPFVNVYSEPLHNPGALSITKNVTGSGADQNKTFEFTVTFDDTLGLTLPTKYTLGGTDITFANGDKITLKNGDTAQFGNLPAGLTYTVSEADYTADGYTATVQNAKGTIASDTTAAALFVNNKPAQPKDTTLTVKKVMDGVTIDPDLKFDFTLYINGAAKETFALKAGDTAVFTVPYSSAYEVRETVQADYSLVSITNGTGTANGSDITVTATNRFTGVETLNISGTKTWNMAADPSVKLPDSITVYLKDGDRTVETKTVTADTNGDWKYTFENVAKYRADGTTAIAYTVDEQPIANYTATVSGYDIQNTYVKPEYASVKVTKTWAGSDPNRPDSVQVQLYKDGGAYGELVTLNAGNNWTYTWTELDKASAWTVDETNVPKDYTKAITGDGLTGYTITNTYTPGTGELVTISGTKYWNHGDNPEANRPKSITLTIYADGKAFVSFALDGTSHWRYSFDLPKYTFDGKEIKYTVDETAVKDYTKSIDGYNITNTYTPGGAKHPGDNSGSPGTGDDSNIGMWLCMMIISGTALASMGGKKKKCSP